MESPYDSDVSEDTRDLIARGLATDIRRYSSQAELGMYDRDIAPSRHMNTSYVRLPPAQIVQVGEPSARGLDEISGEDVRGQIHNKCTFVPQLYIFRGHL